MVVIISATGQLVAYWIGTQQAQKRSCGPIETGYDGCYEKGRREKGGEKDNYRNTRLHILAKCTMWRLQRVF